MTTAPRNPDSRAAARRILEALADEDARRADEDARRAARWSATIAAATLITATATAAIIAVDIAIGAPTTPPGDRAQALANQLKTERGKARATITALRRQNRALRRELRHRPSVQEAITIAAVVSGTPRPVIREVARCESDLNARAENPTSTAAGVMQYLDSTWKNTPMGRAGLSRYSPYAATIQAGLAMRHSLEPWRASRGCWAPRVGWGR